jgi:hypothetical protein
MKLIVPLVGFLILHITSSSIVSNIKCAQIEYIYQDSNCCSSGSNDARCLKQIAQADLDGELASINTKIDDLQYGGMTVQQNAVLQIGASVSDNVVTKTGTLRVEDAGTIQLMNGGAIDFENGATMDVTGGTVTGLGGSATGDAVAVGYMTLLGVVGNTQVSGQLDVNGGLTMDGDKVVITDGSGDISTKGKLAVSGSIDASSLAIDSDKFTVDVLGNVNGLGSITNKGDLKLKTAAGAVSLTLSSESGNIVSEGSAHIKSTLDVDDIARLNKGIDVDTKFTVADITGNTNIVGTLNVAAKTTLTGGVDITGASTLASGSKLMIHGILDVSQGSLVGSYVTATQASITQLTSTLDHSNHAHNNVNLASGKINGVLIGDTAPANAAFLTTAVTDLTASALITGSAGLTVSGTATFNSGATITGAVGGITTLAASGVVSSGGFSTAGNLAVAEIAASGLSNLNGGIAVDTDKFTVDASGNTAAAGTLSATGKASSAGADLVGGAGLRVEATAGVLKASIAHDTGDIMSEGTIHVKQGSTLDGNIGAGADLTVVGLSSLDGGIDVNSNAAVATNGQITTNDGILTQKSSSLKGLVVQADGSQGLTVDGVISLLNGGMSVGLSSTTTGPSTYAESAGAGKTCDAAAIGMAPKYELGGNYIVFTAEKCANWAQIILENNGDYCLDGTKPVISDSATYDYTDCAADSKTQANLASYDGYLAFKTGQCTLCSGAVTADSAEHTHYLASLGTTTTVNDAKFSVSTAGAVVAEGLSKLDGGISVDTDKFSVNEQGHTTASALTVAGSRLPLFQEAEAIDCTGFAADGSVSQTTAGDGKVVVLAIGSCAKTYERYGCMSALTDPNTDGSISEAEFDAHGTTAICPGVFVVDTVDTCTTTLDVNPVIDMGPPGAVVSVAGIYCRPLNTRARCEGSNVYGDVDGSTGSLDPLVSAPGTRVALVWTTSSLEMHMCTSSSGSVKN